MVGTHYPALAMRPLECRSRQQPDTHRPVACIVMGPPRLTFIDCPGEVRRVFGTNPGSTMAIQTRKFLSWVESDPWCSSAEDRSTGKFELGKVRPRKLTRPRNLVNSMSVSDPGDSSQTTGMSPCSPQRVDRCMIELTCKLHVHGAKVRIRNHHRFQGSLDSWNSSLS